MMHDWFELKLEGCWNLVLMIEIETCLMICNVCPYVYLLSTFTCLRIFYKYICSLKSYSFILSKNEDKKNEMKVCLCILAIVKKKKAIGIIMKLKWNKIVILMLKN